MKHKLSYANAFSDQPLIAMIVFQDTDSSISAVIKQSHSSSMASTYYCTGRYSHDTKIHASLQRTDGRHLAHH